MRVTLASSHEGTAANLGRLNADLAQLSIAASSGKRLAKPSDDPMGWAGSMDIKQGLKKLEAYSKNIDFAVSWGNATENALNQLSDLFVRAKEIAIGSINGTLSEKDTAYLSELDQILEEAVSVGNQKYQGRYLFAVNSGQPPFDLSEANAANSNYPISVESNLEGTFTVRVGESSEQKVNVSGADTFLYDPAGDGENSLQHLVKLRKAIADGDTDAISQEMEFIDTAIEGFSKQTSIVGSRLAGLERRQNFLDNMEIGQKSNLSQIEDADMVRTILQLQQKQTAYQAALQVTSMLNGLNLAQYL